MSGRSAFITLGAAVALVATGCAPAATPTGSASPTPVPTVTVTVTATTTTTPTPTVDASLLGPDEAVRVCVGNLTRVSPEDTVLGGARVEERSVLPKWLVLLPAENVNGPYTVACYVSESPNDPANQAIEQSSNSVWTEDRIEFVKHNNEHM